MSTSTERLFGLAAMLALGACAAPHSSTSTSTSTPASASASASANVRYGFGTTPTGAELGRFISPLADGRGLPPGSGTVEQGKLVYEAQCVACHGQKLEGGLGDRLVGGRGTLVNNDPAKAPIKTVESYWPYSTTLFDYIKRAMPLTAPASLSNDEVYAVCAYVLSVANIVPADAVMDARSLAAVRMPNRDGFIPDPRPEHFPPVDATPHQMLGIAAAKK